MSIDTNSIHILAEFWGCDIALLDDEGVLKDHMERAAFEAKATPLCSYSRKFDPSGVTVLTAVAESHLTIHTWPGKGYAALDVFTCGEVCQPDLALKYLKSVLNPEHVRVAKVTRGNMQGMSIASFQMTN